MKPKALLSAIVVSFSLAGCCVAPAVAPALVTKSTCDTPECPIGIFIGADDSIFVFPEELYIRVGKGAHKITWEILQPGYAFADAGIQFEENASGQYSDPTVKRGDTRASSQNANTLAGHYKYTVRVMKGDKQLPDKDPIIVNG